MGHNLIHPNSIRRALARAPATLMLFGEHSVLREGCALVAAVNAYISVEINLRSDSKISIQSDLGDEETSIHEMVLSERFRFLREVFVSCREFLKEGFDCRVVSEFSSTQGLGSSAAVTIASLKALQRVFNFEEPLTEFHLRALQIIRAVQGRGSGADLAACHLGGVVAYSIEPALMMERIREDLPLTICFSGYKTKTPEVIKIVETAARKYPKLYSDLLKMQAESASLALNSLLTKNTEELQTASRISQGVMESLGVSDSFLSKIVWSLRNDPGIIGSKISGSGLGDCVLGFGNLQDDRNLPEGVVLLPYRISQEGVVVRDL